MKIVVMIFGLFLVMSTGAQANRSNVTIKNANKVIINSGMSYKKMKSMIYCLNTLKKHDTAAEAIATAMTKMKEFCSLANVDNAKCAKKQKKVAMKIHFCFEKAKFYRGYIKPVAASQVEADTKQEPEEATESDTL